MIDTLPERPDSLEEDYGLVVTLWQLVPDLRERLGLHSTHSSLAPSGDRLSGRTREPIRCGDLVVLAIILPGIYPRPYSPIASHRAIRRALKSTVATP